MIRGWEEELCISCSTKGAGAHPSPAPRRTTPPPPTPRQIPLPSLLPSSLCTPRGFVFIPHSPWLMRCHVQSDRSVASLTGTFPPRVPQAVAEKSRGGEGQSSVLKRAGLSGAHDYTEWVRGRERERRERRKAGGSSLSRVKDRDREREGGREAGRQAGG